MLANERATSTAERSDTTTSAQRTASVFVAETGAELGEACRRSAGIRPAGGSGAPWRRRRTAAPKQSAATQPGQRRPCARASRDQRLQRIERVVCRELRGQRLVQAHEQSARHAARRRGDRDNDAAQRHRSAIQEDKLGEVCVALWLHRGIVSSLLMSRTRTAPTPHASRRHIQHPAGRRTPSRAGRSMCCDASTRT